MNHPSFYRVIFAFLIFTISATAIGDIASYKSLMGEFKVTGKGSSSYTIPIEVIPAKYAPVVDISYNSSSPGGFMGAGWGISGIPTIELCSKNARQDNKWGNISINISTEDYNQNRFCLTGSRLSLLAGTFGADGSTYQTELVSQQRITAQGSCGDGPCSFKLENNDGSVHIFGGSAQSTVRLKDNGVPKDILTWGISSSQDLNGNTIDYEYKPSTTSNVLFPDNIKYFFNADKSTYREVLFSYKPRETTTRQIKRVGLGGYAHRPSLVLTSISTKDTDGTTVLKYELESEYKSLVDQYQITKVQKVSGDGTTATYPTTFGYKEFEAQTPDFREVNSVSLGFPGVTFSSAKTLVMDKYGDGYNGIGVIGKVSGNAEFRFARGDKNGNLTVATDAMDLGEYSSSTDDKDAYTFLSFDKNGDGLGDLVKIYKGGDGLAYAQTYLSAAGVPNFTRVGVVVQLGQDYVTSGGKSTYTSSDVNGDGLIDLIRLTPTANGLQTFYVVTAFYSSEKGGFPKREIISDTILHGLTLTTDLDINFIDGDGDTLRDIFVVKTASGVTSAAILYNRQGSFLTPPTGSPFVSLGALGAWKGNPPYKIIDFNQDGLSDLITFAYPGGLSSTSSIYMNTGKLFSQILEAPAEGDNTTTTFRSGILNQDDIRSIVFGDINGDSFPDLLIYQGGSGDPGPSTEGNTYFSYYLHTGNSFAFGSNLSPLGEHTRNIIATMGNKSLASIVSLRIGGDEAIISVHTNQVEEFRPQIISIDNGGGVKYAIKYDKKAPLVDYAHLKTPKYPDLVLSKIRTIVDSYVKTKDVGKSYGYTRTHSFDYTLPVYNRQDWKFAGYRTVTEKVPELDMITTRTYSTSFPIRGRIASTTVGKITTGEVFTGTDVTYKHEVTFPNTVPKVVLVHSDTSSKTTFEGTSRGAPVQAWKSTVVNVVDDVWGFNLSSAKTFDGSADTLYTCNRYSNVVSSTKFHIGMPTGHLVTSSKSQCEAFYGMKPYDSPFTPTSADFSLSLMKYDAVGRPITKLLYSSENDAYITSHTAYDAQGYVTSTSISPDYTPLTGIFPTAANVKTTTFTRDVGGYTNKMMVTGLSTDYETNSRFGIITKQTLPNGKVITHTLDPLGTKIARTLGTTKVTEIKFKTDSEGKFSEKINYVGSKESKLNQYRDGLGAIWKTTQIADGNRKITGGIRERDTSTGLVSKLFGNYFIPADSSSSTITYDDRWARDSLAWDGGNLKYEYDRTYSDGKLSVVTSGYDPRTLITGDNPIVLGTKVTDFVSRTVTSSKSRSTSSVSTLDLLGRRISSVDFRGLPTTTKYDMDGTVVQISSPDAGVEKTTWDAMGNVVKTERGIEQITYLYDKIGRLAKKTRIEGGGTPRVVNFTWDTPRAGKFNTGFLTKIEDSGVIRELDYNQGGLKVAESWHIDGVDYDYEFSYLNTGHPESITYPDKSKVEYEYLDSGELGTLKYSSPPSGILRMVSNFLFGATDGLLTFSDYDINGHASTIKYSDTLTITETVDKFGRADTYSILDGGKKSEGGTVLSSMKYKWGNTNKIVGQTRDNENYKYTYDIEGRLISYSNSREHVTYTYDENENILSKGDSKFVIDTASNRPVSGVISGNDITFQYDSLGRLLGDGQETYTYGTSGKLSKINTPIAGETTIRYFNNQKLSDTRNGATVTYLTAGYVDLGAGSTKRISMDGKVRLSVNPDESLLFLFSDRLGSNLMTIDIETKKPTSSYEYLPYGDSNDI